MSLFRRNPYVPVLKATDGLFGGASVALGAWLNSQRWEFAAMAVFGFGCWYIIETRDSLRWRRWIRNVEAAREERSP